MPLYEYYCVHCNRRFEMLRPMSQANAPATCPLCASPDVERTISVFAAVSKDAGGSSRLVASSTGSSCSTCAGGTCSTCGH